MLIEDGRIVSVERRKGTKKPAGATVVSGKGQFLIPGLISGGKAETWRCDCGHENISVRSQTSHCCVLYSEMYARSRPTEAQMIGALKQVEVG